jgi:signal transduction histidine kinase
VIIAPDPENEDIRLKALHDYEVLDTEPEASFDSIVELASQICNVPIVLVSLVDSDRQWFKAKVGLDAEETSRDLAFCAHAIHQDIPLIVGDALKDKRFHDNPLVAGGPKIRFYAGAPLQNPSGQRLGTLCAIDTVPRQLSEQQIKALQTLSNHVVDLLELRQKHRETVRLNQALVRGHDELLKMSDHNRRFLANLNHEMRTPLNALIGFSTRLLKRLEGLDLPGYVTEGLDAIQLASRNLNHLINNVLDLSKIDANKMHCELSPFSAEKLFREVMVINQERAIDNKITLDLQLQPSVPDCLLGDKTKITQVLMNVVSNAIKYTPEEKSVQVQVDYVDGNLIVRVSDEGIGIAEENLQKIFDEFEQIPNKLSNRSKGTGLGLSIVARLMGLLGGSINVTSQVGKGTQFILTFPLSICKNS